MIGRSDEAAAIGRFVDRTAIGSVGFLIEGEPGIGKTTVVIEAIREASARGYRVIQVRPAEAEADLSFAGLGDLLGGVFDEISEALPPPQRHALETALLLREADTPADPRSTASALLSALSILSSRAPLVIAIDDAQWMDRASRRALEFAARRLPQRTGMLVASRPEIGPTSPLDLVRAFAPADLEHLVLGPLSIAALHHLIRDRSQLDLARPLLVRIADTSSGNPFYALEISGALARLPALPGLGRSAPCAANLARSAERPDRPTLCAGAGRGIGRCGALATDRRDHRRCPRVGRRRGCCAARG